MTVEDRIKSIILERYGSVSEFTKTIGMANSTFATIMKNGLRKANVSNVIKICKELNISADELVHDRIAHVGQIAQSQTDIESIIASAKIDILSASDLTLGGTSLSDDERQTIIDALELSVELIKRKKERDAK